VSGDAVPGRPHFYRRVALGTALPGAGLVRTSWRLIGWTLLVLFLAGAVYVVYRVVTQGGVVDAVLDLAVDPVALDALAAVLMVVGVLWVGSIVLTAERAWPRHSGRTVVWKSLFVLAACAVVAAPMSVAVRYLEVQSELVSSVFAAPRPAPTVVVPAEASEEATPTPTDPWAGVDRVNLVLLGSDAGKGRIGVRTDSMMVVSIDPRSGDTLLIGVPRNLENVPIPKSNPLHALYPNGYNCGDECLMNAIWTLAETRPDLFPDNPEAGRSSTVDVLGAITGLDLSSSVVIDLSGFRQLVDAMGGVDVNVTERVCVECHVVNGALAWTTDRREWIEPGLQHLDGKHALWYARSRATSDDFSRMRRQRCVAGALLQQADPVSLFARYPRIAKAVQDSVSVDIPADELPDWVDLVQRVQSGGSIRSLPLTNDVVNPGNPDYKKIRKLVRRALKPPPTPVSTPTDVPRPTETATDGDRTPSPSPSPSKSRRSNPSVAQDLAATC
jgi:LCP family protein required for cell wall assembly